MLMYHLGPLGCQLAVIHVDALARNPPEAANRLAKIVGKNMIDGAKMIGMTPAVLMRSGRKLRRPCDAIPVRGFSTRCADCTGTLRCACCTPMIPAVTTSAMTATPMIWMMCVPPVVL